MVTWSVCCHRDEGGAGGVERRRRCQSGVWWTRPKKANPFVVAVFVGSPGAAPSRAVHSGRSSPSSPAHSLRPATDALPCDLSTALHRRELLRPYHETCPPHASRVPAAVTVAAPLARVQLDSPCPQCQPPMTASFDLSSHTLADPNDVGESDAVADVAVALLQLSPALREHLWDDTQGASDGPLCWKEGRTRGPSSSRILQWFGCRRIGSVPTARPSCGTHPAARQTLAWPLPSFVLSPST
mmetsp:Transcript_8382/g.20550  ORF Transcript_8382/g.20550 Transcript_8382/m.20550 type:complete len:242 (-) Transcript_8382:809-1534(-)